MLTCFVVGFLASIVAIAALASVAGIVWFLRLMVKHTPVDRYEDGEQSDRDVQQIIDSTRAPLENPRIRGLS